MFLPLTLGGPQASVYSYTLTADNSTVTSVDLGELGGGRLEAVSDFSEDGETLRTECSDPQTGEVKVIMERTRRKGEEYFGTIIEKSV